MKSWNSLVIASAIVALGAHAQTAVSNGRQGISFGLPDAGGASLGYVQVQQDNQEIRYDLDFDLNKAGKDIDTTFAFSVDVGFRKYLTEAGKVKIYHQPGVFVSKAATGEFTAALTLGAGYTIGGEFVVSPNFSFGARTGINLAISKEFKAFSLRTGTSALTGTYYW